MFGFIRRIIQFVERLFANEFFRRFTKAGRLAIQNKRFYLANINRANYSNDFNSVNQCLTLLGAEATAISHKKWHLPLSNDTYDFFMIFLSTCHNKYLSPLAQMPLSIYKLENMKNTLSIFEDGPRKTELLDTINALIKFIADHKNLRQRSELVKIINDADSQQHSRETLSNDLFIHGNTNVVKGITDQRYYSHINMLEYLIQRANKFKSTWRSTSETNRLLDRIILRNKRKLTLLQSGQKVMMPSYYHATTIGNALLILRSGKIEVRHEKAYPGAFVSTMPEVGFGNVIFVFSGIEIERKCGLLHGFKHHDAYWAGMSEDISLGKLSDTHDYTKKYTRSNLAYIIANKAEDVTQLKSTLTSMGLPNLEVISLEESEVERQLLVQFRGSAIIPSEWNNRLRYQYATARIDHPILIQPHIEPTSPDNPFQQVAHLHISLASVLTQSNALSLTGLIEQLLSLEIPCVTALKAVKQAVSSGSLFSTATPVPASHTRPRVPRARRSASQTSLAALQHAPTSAAPAQQKQQQDRARVMMMRH